MSKNAHQDRLQLGFLTAIETPDGGYVGGLLVTNRFGRPLEFQCTKPVIPNRTQEVLYGPTLVPYLLAELIGRTLVEKVSVKPDLVLIEDWRLLELRDHVTVAVAYLEEKISDQPRDLPVSESVDEEPESAEEHGAIQADHSHAELSLGRQKLCFHADHRTDRETIACHAHLIPHDANLREPFDRVREALKEAISEAVSRNAA